MLNKLKQMEKIRFDYKYYSVCVSSIIFTSLILVTNKYF